LYLKNSSAPEKTTWLMYFSTSCCHPKPWSMMWIFYLLYRHFDIGFVFYFGFANAGRCFNFKWHQYHSKSILSRKFRDHCIKFLD
jgi:hypothetical protein